MDIITASIPLFFALIGLEVLVARRRRHASYRLNDSIADLSCGILSELAGVFNVLVAYGAFAWVSAHWSLQRWLPLPDWPSGSPVAASGGLLGFTVRWPELAAWATVFVLADFAYYVMHRASHRSHLLWAGHVVHHSSEEYNLTVALRQSALHGLMSWVFYVPLALGGVPWLMFAVCHGLNLIYQFWIHTREIGRLGPLEWFMNTPSHHRVHHGVNPKYQDRNYAGVFIVWDKLFGTFQPEEEEPVYGITKPLASWNPLWANVHVFTDIFRIARRTRRWRDKLKVVFGPPSWRPAEVGPSIEAPEVSAASFERFDPAAPPGVRRYVAVQFVAHLVGALALLRAAHDLPAVQLLAGGFYLALGLGNLGSLLEARRWIWPLEAARCLTLVAVCGALLILPRFDPALIWGVGLFGALSLGWLIRLRPALAGTAEIALARG